MTGLQSQDRENEPLLTRPEGDRTAIKEGPYRPQQPQLHRHQRDPSGERCPDYEPTMTGELHAHVMRIDNRHDPASGRARLAGAYLRITTEPLRSKQKEKSVTLARALLRSTVLTISAGALVAGCSAGPSTSAAAPKAAATTAPATSPASVAASTPSAGGKLDPCSMLTTDQVTAALGEPPAAGKPEPNFDAPECEWDPASGHNGTVTLDVGPWSGDPGVEPIRLGTPVPNVGDEAYDGGNTGLYVHKGAEGFRIWVFNVHTQSSRLELEKQLATILLTEM